jgi:hypothetical protein
MIDVIRTIGAVAREVGSRDHAGRPARVVVATRTYDTNAERIPRWFMPITGDLRLGGRYQLKGNAGGAITACEPPRHLAVTWEFGGDVSWVNVNLSGDPKGGTRLVLEHVAHVDEERWDQYGPGAVGVGWDMALMGLGLHLESGAPVDTQAAMAWLGTAEGKDLVKRSSEDWRRASVADGTDPEAAEAAARRTTAFYTGESDPTAKG